MEARKGDIPVYCGSCLIEFQVRDFIISNLALLLAPCYMCAFVCPCFPLALFLPLYSSCICVGAVMC